MKSQVTTTAANYICNIKPEKNSGMNRIWTYDLCDTSAVPVGFLAPSVDHCTGVAEVMVSNPIQVWFFFQALISQLLTLFI